MNDPRFSPENLEKAAICSQDPNSPNQQEANDLLYEWSQQPDPVITALDLISSAQDFSSSFIFSAVIKNMLPDYWGQFDAEQKNKYRDQIVELIFSVPNVDNHISYDLIHGFCDIAIFDWPEEYPNFSDIVFPPENSPTLNISIRILSMYMEELDITRIITDSRRNNIRQTILANLHEKIMEVIRNYISVPELSVDVLNICNYFLRWGSTEDIIDFDLFQKLSLEFLPNEQTCEKAVQCLNSIFISRTDSAVAFRTFSPFLADALAKGVFPNQQPITSNQHVMNFLLRFLLEYSSVFELVLNYDNAKEESKMESLIDENVSLLVETMNEKGIGPANLHEDLLSLYQIILSISPEDIAENFQLAYWQLWDNNLRRVCYEQNHQMPVNPSSDFFMPFFEEITKSLFMALGSSIDDEGICIFQARTTIGSLYMINPDAYVNFLKAQPPSPQLCYAVGTIEFVISKSQIENILLLIVELMQYANDNSSSEYQVALLFGLSHSTKCFESNDQIFSQFIEYTCNSMVGNEQNVADAATHALQYVVQRRAGLFKGDCRYYAEALIGNSESYLHNLDSSSAIRIFKVCTWLICYNKKSHMVDTIHSNIINGIEIIQITTNIESNNKEEPLDESATQSLYEKLFEPVGAVLSKVDEYKEETVETALDIIRDCCYASPSSVSYIFELLWPISELAMNMIPNPEVTNSNLSYILSAMSAMQVSLTWDAVGPQIEEIYQLIKNSGRYEDCFFDYFGTLRNIFKEMDPLYPQIYEDLILPLTQSEEPLPPSLFLMISQFTPEVIDIEWLSMAAIQALNDYRTDVGEDALNSLQSMMFNMSKDNLIKFLQNVAPQLINALIGSIIDLMHKPLFSRLVDFLRFIITSADLGRSENGEYDLQNMIKETIANSLSQSAPEPEEGFFNNFAEYIMSVQRQFFKFKGAFGNLLVVLKKSSPGDAELFKIEPAQQNSLFSMIFESFFKNFAPIYQPTNDDAKSNKRFRSSRLREITNKQIKASNATMSQQQQQDDAQNEQQQQQDDGNKQQPQGGFTFSFPGLPNKPSNNFGWGSKGGGGWGI